MVDEAGFPKEASVRVYDVPYDGATGSDRLSSNSLNMTFNVKNFSETGFEPKVTHKMTMGGNSIPIYSGRSDIEISFSVRVRNDDILWKEVTQTRPNLNQEDMWGINYGVYGWHIILDFDGIDREIHYDNLIFCGWTESADADGILEGEVKFRAPAWDEIREVWNKREI